MSQHHPTKPTSTSYQEMKALLQQVTGALRLITKDPDELPTQEVLKLILEAHRDLDAAHRIAAKRITG